MLFSRLRLNGPAEIELLNGGEQGQSNRLEVHVKAEVYISGGRNISEPLREP